MGRNSATAIVGFGLALGGATATNGHSTKLVPVEVATGDEYGSSVSVWGTAAIVGSPLDDENGLEAGAVYLLKRDCASWVVIRKFLHEQVGAGDRFGSAVEMRDDLMVIGAVQADDAVANAGAAYVYRLSGDAWVFEQILLPDPASSGMNFGAAVAISVDVIVVGAVADDENGTDSGAAYVFRFDGKTWTQEQKLFASDGDSSDFFGSSVAVDGDACLIGSPSALATNFSAGAAYRFHYNGSSWSEVQKLVSLDGRNGDAFGSAVAFDSARTIVGAPKDNATQLDSGSAYIFGFNGSTWVQRQKLLPHVEAAFDRFGHSVALSGEAVVIASPGDLNNSSTPGSAEVFRFNGSTWAWERTLSAADGAAQDGFGWSVGLFGDRAISGAPMDDASAGSTYVDYIGPIDSGDLDRDGDTDLVDFNSFASCLTGPNPPGAIPVVCESSDLDGDQDVDLSDIAIFQMTFACEN